MGALTGRAAPAGAGAFGTKASRHFVTLYNDKYLQSLVPMVVVHPKRQRILLVIETLVKLVHNIFLSYSIFATNYNESVLPLDWLT